MIEVTQTVENQQAPHLGLAPVPPVMPIPDFCRLFGVGRSFAYQEAKAGRLTLTRIGGMTRVTAPDAFAWLQHYRRDEAPN